MLKQFALAALAAVGSATHLTEGATLSAQLTSESGQSATGEFAVVAQDPIAPLVLAQKQNPPGMENCSDLVKKKGYHPTKYGFFAAASSYEFRESEEFYAHHELDCKYAFATFTFCQNQNYEVSVLKLLSDGCPRGVTGGLKLTRDQVITAGSNASVRVREERDGDYYWYIHVLTKRDTFSYVVSYSENGSSLDQDHFALGAPKMSLDFMEDYEFAESEKMSVVPKISNNMEYPTCYFNFALEDKIEGTYVIAETVDDCDDMTYVWFVKTSDGAFTGIELGVWIQEADEHKIKVKMSKDKYKCEPSSTPYSTWMKCFVYLERGERSGFLVPWVLTKEEREEMVIQFRETK